MNFLQYIKRTPLAQIRKDWQEYQGYKKRLMIYTHCADVYYAQVQQKYPCYDVHCMEIDIPDAYDKKRTTTKYCKKFFNKECDQGCPMAEQHDKYWKCCEKRDVATLAYLTYWQNKFQNVK